MATENDQTRISELPGEPSVSEVAGVLEKDGLLDAAEKLGLPPFRLEAIRKKYGIKIEWAARPPQLLPEQGPISGAGFWIRALARLIDLAFGQILGLVAGFCAGFILVILEITGSIAPGWQERVQGISVAGIGLSLLGAFLYHSCSEGIHGASLGKLVCRLRVLQRDGQASKMKGAFKRNLGYYMDALFFGAVGYDSMKKSALNQRYGDVWGRTVVVKTKDIPSDAKRSVFRFVLGLFIGATCWAALLAFGFLLKA